MRDEVAEPSFEGDAPVAAKREVMPDRRELALVSFERTRMPMVVTDPRQHDNPIILANEAFLKLTGYTADEVLGRNCRFLQGPDTDPEAVEAIRRGLADGSDFIEIEILNYRKDGSAFWDELAISPITDAAGELVYYFASQRDVTARRRAQELEASERLLLMEVDHRAMNALAMVQSFVSVSRSDTANGFAAAVRGRVQSLARAHRLLGEGTWTEVDLGKLFAAETPEPLRERVSSASKPVPIPAPLVQPMALVLHELMSNAQRHGALSGRSGTVEVDWTHQDGRLRLTWRERVPRKVVAPSAEGVGFKLVKSVVERQIGGDLGVEWLPDGVHVDLAVPLDGRSSKLG